jgi:hypothetical protein
MANVAGMASCFVVGSVGGMGRRGEEGRVLDALDLRGVRRSDSLVSGMGAEDERRYERSVIGASKRVIISGTCCLSNSWIARSSS